MAQAKNVKPGQVWTAKVSGKPTKVEIVGETTSSAGGRTRFLWKNLNTGRTSAGGAGKLHDLVRDASAGAAVAAPAPAAPAPARATRRPPPPRQARQGFGPPPSRQAQQDERRAAVSALGWKPETGSADERYAATTGEMLAWGREAPPAKNLPARLGVEDRSHYTMRGEAGWPAGATSLPSLRSTRPATAQTARQNPKHYPSAVARSAAEAISRSGAQSPHDVLQVIQSWASSFAPAYVAPPPGYGAPPGFNPYGQPPRPY